MRRRPASTKRVVNLKTKDAQQTAAACFQRGHALDRRRGERWGFWRVGLRLQFKGQEQYERSKTCNGDRRNSFCRSKMKSHEFLSTSRNASAGCSARRMTATCTKVHELSSNNAMRPLTHSFLKSVLADINTLCLKPRDAIREIETPQLLKLLRIA